jgi:FmdE, Molybdenum formylmethanofuran dehydrogenase operon
MRWSLRINASSVRLFPDRLIFCDPHLARAYSTRRATNFALLEISLKTSTLLAVAVLLLGLSPARSETREQWIELGARVHGAFGAFIPVGIRIGLDAKERLKADPRGLSVTYYNGEKPPCPCVADGVMIATQASPGQGTLQMGSEKATPGIMAAIVIRNRKTGEGLKYSIADNWLPTILGWNKLDPAARFDAAMAADHLFQSEPAP